MIADSHSALPVLKKQFGRLACLSNDVSSWSLKLRRRFEFESWIDEWLISGDLGLRKPSPAIYLKAVERLGVAPGEITFVDDRPRNLDSAQDLGINTVLRDVGGDQPRSSHRRIRRLIDLL